MAHIPFSHMLVNPTCSIAYMLGSLHECRVYQMKHGLRATTIIIEG